MKLQILIIAYNLINIANCDDKKEEFKSKSSLPFFRRQVGNYRRGDSSIAALQSQEMRSDNLASFLVDNLKELFDDNSLEENVISSTTSTTATHNSINITSSLSASNNKEDTKLKTDGSAHCNTMSRNSLKIFNFTIADQGSNDLEMSSSHMVKLFDKFEKTSAKQENKGNPTNKTNKTKRSCIFCDNIEIEHCDDPKNKLVPSIVCERDTDVCYSQHTPFGIIDRGCFNVEHNLTTYVCSCNLCNYISISDMPYIFSNKQEWADNVAELSRTRNFRKSVFKDMACLRCEVHSIDKTIDPLDNMRCLEGSVTSVPTQVCKENQVCALIAIKSEGYVWRGCVDAPLYNYWLELCDTDFCNYKPLEPVYNFYNTFVV